MTTKLTISILTCLLFFACTNPNNPDTKIVSDKENEDGPPFSDSCACSFHHIAAIRTNKNRFDLVISGKGWNPEFYSCSWAWGELINNESTPDSNITDFRIHLLDIDKLTNNPDSTFLNSEQFNNNLIATYSKTKNDEYMTCRFDPNKTGKYPKPKQWSE